MGMFDPEGKYLGGHPGMKLNFRDPQNQALVSCMPQQFEPFQGIFGCYLKDDGTPISYEGTLFRFPLRTPQQEAESRLNAKCYNREKRREFLKLILESAGNLLMFTQSVHVLEIFHIADDNSDPGSPDCLLSMSKTSKRLHGVSLGETAILQYCTHRWQTQQDIKIYEELDVNVKMTNIAEDLCEVKACDSTTHWRVAWATGTGESAGIARSRSHRNQSLLPLAAVAVPLDKGCILQLDQLPPGFYRTGHLFCFLPLPEELGHGALPVHVNSTFSLTSSRRSLLEQTEDDVDSLKTKWNRALFVDPVCRAYILLLESLQGVAQKDDYSAYFHLWPQAASATVQEMKVSFYKHVTAGGSMLFPVPHTGRWVDFQTARFLEPTFRDSECGSIALKVLQKFWKGDGSIVDVPKNICLLIKAAEEKAFKTKVVTKAAFYKDVFFPNIKDDWWKLDEREKERDRLILHAVLQDHQDIQRLLRNHQCIPCEGTPDLRRPGDLIHPEKEAAKLFLPSEGFFPQCKDPKENTHVVHFRSKKILERLAKLGMTTDDLSPDRVLERTKSVAALFAFAESRQLALDRACRVVDYMSSYSALHSKLRIDLLPPETKAALSDIMFLPVLRKPEHWPFPWEGDADQPELASPSSLFVDRLRDLVACNAKLLNSHSLGYAGSQQEEKTRVLALLGVGVDKDHENKQLLTLTIAQLKTIAGEYRKYRSINKETLQAVLVAIYSFLDQCLGFSPQTAVFISEHLASVECVWAENEFVLPRHVAFHCKFDCRPYLYKLEGNLEQYMRLFEKLGVKEKFSTTDGLDVLKCIHEEKAGSQLSEDEVRLVGRVAQMVCEATQDDGDSIDKSQVFLPDRECFMCPVDGLCFDDTDWLSPNDSMRFLNGKIPLETARILGVKTKKREDFVRMAKALPWAQKEELTTRIKRLLQGYTFDSSILQELIQNAEDARATEIHFIKDFRNLSTERVVEGCSFLQGPALCVYNNSFFTEEDLKGIISLGEGSKGLEPLKVGQYGVGFNAVYHLTDIPSFWTRRDDGKEVMVVLDPNCQHLPVEGGVRLEEIDQNSYSDTFQGFLRDCQPEYMSKPGTLFRFPLRTEEMAKTSQIKDLPVTESQLTEMMDSFVEEMERCLLFLNSVRSIGIYTVSEEGTLKRECQVAKQLDEPSHKELRRFQCYLEEAAAKLREGAQPTDIEEFESVLFMSIKNSRDCAEEWLTVNRIGFASMARREQMQTNFRGENFKCLPSGGVAVQLSESSAGGQAPPPTKDCLAFCVLPLPVCTGLPMHINGHFALDHETRRGLWDNKDDARKEWNKAIALQIVVPAYITAIQRVKNVWFSADEGGTRLTSTYLQHYHSLFPDLQNAFSTYPWKLLMEELYRQIARLELPLFPVVREDISIITWAPVVKTDGFPGYFSDSVKFFKEVLPVTKDSDKRKAEKRNVLFHRLLKGLNMKVLYTPYSAMRNFVESGVEHVQEVCPATVITFLKSASSTQEGKCSLGSLPRPVSDTPFLDATNVQLFLKFVKTDKEFVEKMEGLPLCLRQSGQLHIFEKTEDVRKPIVSTFLRLLPQSSDRFLHKQILNYFLPMEESTKEMIQELDIPLLARLLPETISEPIYKTGTPCPFLIDRHPCPDKHPDQTWLKDLWGFLEGQLKLPGEEGTENPHNSWENKLECLADWSLIPVKKQNDGVEEQLLFPIQDAQSVVHLSASRDKSRPQLLETLKSLPLPFLNTFSLPILSIATELVASISHPSALFHALTSCGTCLTKSKKDASCILSYFNDSLPTLQESFKDDGRLRQKLKHLPFFSSIGGDIGPVSANTLTICIGSSVPDEGLSQWMERRQNSVLLLRLADVPHNLQEFLGFTVASDLEFYCGYVLPSFADLPKNAMLIHMTYVRELLKHEIHQEDEEERLCLQLQQTAFVECQGHLHRASYFFSPHQPVFNQMCPADRFPPEPYSESEWRSFMRKAGIIWEVTVDMFIDFARRLEEEGQVGVTEGVAEKSGVLVRHLYDVLVSTQRLKDTCLFQKIRNIRFLLQSDWTAQRGKRRYLALVARPLIQDRLVSFAESCSERHLHLVWTSSPILHREADPYSKAPPEQLHEILQQLEWKKCAPEDKVKKHIQKMCDALQEDHPENSPAWNDSSVDILDTVMMDVYRYLDSMSDLTELIKLPLVCDTENKRLFHAENVVIYASEDEVFAECIQKLPVKFGGFASLFKRLGVSERPTASHYARVLSHIKRQRGDSQLEDEDTNNVKKAVQGLFKCLRSNVEEERRLQVDHLYLPSEQNKLLKSSELVFSNDQHLKDRYEELPHRQLDFLQDFSLLQIRVPRPQDDIRRLPEEHKVRSLSDIVKVVIPDEIRIKAFDGDFSQSLKYKLVQPECVACVIRLAYHQHMHEETSRGEFNEETERSIAQKMFLINVKEITGLKTVLVEQGQVLEDSEMSQSLFVYCSDDGKYALYLDTEKSRSLIQTSRGLALAVQSALEFLPSLASNLQNVFEDPTKASKEMDLYGIEQYKAMTVEDTSVFPPLGTYVPTAFHLYLVYRVDSGFLPRQRVAYELYDPLVNEDDTEDNVPCYVCAVVMKRIEERAGGDTTECFSQYIIDPGPDHGGEREVSGTELYKLCQQPVRRENRGDVAVPLVLMSQEEGTVDAEDLPPNIDEVLRQIRQTLTEAWRQPCPTKRRRVVMRLYMQWNPARNFDKEFCTKVIKRIKQCVALLDHGMSLDAEYTAAELKDFSNSPSFLAFFVRLDERCRRNNVKSDTEVLDFRRWSGRRRPNPQPGEAVLYIRQAEADLAAAQAARGTCDKGHNWICYQCHQAVEKALKAVILDKNAVEDSLSHDLTGLAEFVHDPDLISVARQLEVCVGQHTHMRYPHCRRQGKIPADVYVTDEARDACGYAEQALQRARRLLMRGRNLPIP